MFYRCAWDVNLVNLACVVERCLAISCRYVRSSSRTATTAGLTPSSEQEVLLDPMAWHGADQRNVKQVKNLRQVLNQWTERYAPWAE